MKKKGAKTYITAIVPSAGKGRRFKSGVPKPFALLNKRPVLLYALKALQSSIFIDDIVLVIDRSLVNSARRLIKRAGITKVRCCTGGGKTRSASVQNGLRCIDKKTSLVLIHDGVRPFINKDMIKRAVSAAKKFGASVAAVPVKATIKISKEKSFVKYTPDRSGVWEVQTPQVFRRGLIEKAYAKIGRNKSFTDDASLVENFGKRVKIVKGDYGNIKITTPEDIKIAEALLRR